MHRREGRHGTVIAPERHGVPPHDHVDAHVHVPLGNVQARLAQQLPVADDVVEALEGRLSYRGICATAVAVVRLGAGAGRLLHSRRCCGLLESLSGAEASGSRDGATDHSGRRGGGERARWGSDLR